MDKLVIRNGQTNRMQIRPEGASNRVTLSGALPATVKDYEKLNKKPKINGVELIGNKKTRDLGIEVTDPLTNFELEAIIQHVMEG